MTAIRRCRGCPNIGYAHVGYYGGYYDGYYDGYYGPFYDGYWGTDGSSTIGYRRTGLERDTDGHFRTSSVGIPTSFMTIGFKSGSDAQAEPPSFNSSRMLGIASGFEPLCP